MILKTSFYDMNQTKKVISKISVDSIFFFTLTSHVHDYVHWHCSIDLLC